MSATRRWRRTATASSPSTIAASAASPGEITQEHVLDDGLAAYDWAEAKGFPIVIWGRSLGSGPATYVASERAADALLLETPFDSAVAVAHDRYWYMPVDLLMTTSFRSTSGSRRSKRRCSWRTARPTRPSACITGSGSMTSRRTKPGSGSCRAPTTTICGRRRVGQGEGVFQRCRNGGGHAGCGRALHRCAGLPARGTRCARKQKRRPSGPAFSNSMRSISVEREIGPGRASSSRPTWAWTLQRLQREALVRAADQPVAAEADADGRFARGADIVAGERMLGASVPSWRRTPASRLGSCAV